MVRLVFAVLYKLAWTESCRHDMAAKWHEKYIEHMEARILVWLGLVWLFGLGLVWLEAKWLEKYRYLH